MHRLATVGRILYAVAVVALGVEHLIRGDFARGLLPFPAAFPARFVVALALGIAFVVAGFFICIPWKARLAGSRLGLLFLLLMLYPHAPILLANLHNGGEWTAFTELMGFSGGAFYLAGRAQPWSATVESRFNLVVISRWLFVVTLVIFAIQHFIYATYIATLIPAWIPARLFWSYFVGVAFAGTAISLLFNRQRPLSTGLLGLMFLLWVLILHGPRVAAKPQIEPEWTSLFVALAMSGIAFSMAGSGEGKRDVVRTDELVTQAKLL